MTSNAEAAAQADNQKNVQVRSHNATPTHGGPDKKLHAKQICEEAGGQLNPRQEGELEVNVNKQHRVHLKDQISEQPTKAADAKVDLKEGGGMNGAVKEGGSASMRGHVSAEVSKQQSLHVATTERSNKGGSQMIARPPVTPPLLGHPSRPIIKLEPLDVKGFCDEVQSMEVR